MIFFFRFLITTLFLILIYNIYRSEIYWQGSNRSYYLIYYIVILLAIFFSIIFSYLNLKIKKYIIIIFISTIFTLYFFEGKLIFDQNKNYAENIKKNNLNFDRRGRFEVYEDLKKTNLNITLSVSSQNFLKLNDLDFLSLAGISNTKTIYCNENGYYSIYQSDRYGFNNPDTEWDSKEIEYLLVGDSFTHGACVNRPNDIASVIRQYSKKNVLNLGQGGNGPLTELATLREYLTPNIKNVIWLYYEGNDLADLQSELKNKILNKYLTNQNFNQDLKFNQILIDQFLTTFVEREAESEKVRQTERQIQRQSIHEAKIIKFIKLLNVRHLLIPPPKPPPELKVILNLANELVRSYNGKLYFIYLPQYGRYTKSINMNYKQQIKKIVIDLDIKFIDIDEDVFKSQKYPLKLFPGQYAHYNVEGYKKVALKIYERTK